MFLWWFCGGVFEVVFWLCFCGGFVVVFLRWYSGCVFVVVFVMIAQSSAQVMAVVKDCHQTSPKNLPK